MKNWRISSIRKQPNKSRFLCGLGLLVVLLALASLCFGAVPLTPEEILGAFLGGTRDSAASQIVLLARLPRTCGCLLAGAALAVSGTVIQGVLDNPLASPNIIGVNSGAGLLVAVSCALFPNAVTLITFTAILGAAGAVFLVLFLAERTGASRITLVLAGIAVSGIFSAGIDAVVTFVPEALNGYSDFRIGGLANLSMTRVAPAFWIILVAMLLVLSLSGELDVLLLGTETARSLGLPAKQLRLTLLALAAFIDSAAASSSSRAAMRSSGVGSGLGCCAAACSKAAISSGVISRYCPFTHFFMFSPHRFESSFPHRTHLWKYLRMIFQKLGFRRQQCRGQAH